MSAKTIHTLLRELALGVFASSLIARSCRWGKCRLLVSIGDRQATRRNVLAPEQPRTRSANLGPAARRAVAPCPLRTARARASAPRAKARESVERRRRRSAWSPAYRRLEQFRR